MKVFHITYPLLPMEDVVPTVMAIGYFDGVHLGHRRVIQKAIDTGKRKELETAVMTFHPHPREVLGKSGYNRYLTPLSEKLVQFEKLGVDRVYIVQFDIAFSSIYPEDFIDEVLVPLQVKNLVVGFDFTFGHRGMGTTETLRMCSKGRYDVAVVSPVNRYGEKISSTIIREYLYQGQVEQAGRFLGRPFRIAGKVVHGEKRGRSIGFPTANLSLTEPFLIPKNGVYGVMVHMRDTTRYGVMNIGIKPTFENERKEKSLEVFILDYSGDLYGEELFVDFLFFLRDEQKFAGVDALIAQIEADVRLAKEKFARM